MWVNACIKAVNYTNNDDDDDDNNNNFYKNIITNK
jgi:hypothetical protein